MNMKLCLFLILLVVLFVAVQAASTSKKAVSSKAATSKAASSKGATSKGATSKGATSKGASSKGATSKGASSKGATSKGASSKAAGSKSAATKGSPSMSPAPNTICNRYSAALNITNVLLMNQIIVPLERSVFDVSASPGNDLAQYFNGTTPQNSRNFLDPKNKDLLGSLNDRFVAFFGEIYGCTQPDFPRFYRTGNLRRMHQRMMLTDAQFNEFQAALGNVLTGLGVASTDVTTATTALEPFRSKIVRNRRRGKALPSTSFSVAPS